VLQTTDVHGHILPFDYHANTANHSGGLARIASLVTQARTDAGHENCLLLDTGDFLQGTPLSDLTPLPGQGWRGRNPVLRAMNLMGYDAMCLGNHEFDQGWENTVKRINQADFPVLAANIFYKGTDIPFAMPCTILNRGGIRIGIIGILIAIMVPQVDKIRIRAKEEVNPDYIYMFLHSFAYWSQIVNLNERNFRPKANAENLKSLILPDCPKSIQDEAVRISQGEKIKGYENLFSEIEKALTEYDKTQEVENLLTNQLTQLENLNQAILQEAVQGKLVKQDKNDEPASELLQRIKAEKLKSGKKEKPLPPIKPEEIPFEIPENWVWCRLGDTVPGFPGCVVWIGEHC